MKLVVCDADRRKAEEYKTRMYNYMNEEIDRSAVEVESFLKNGRVKRSFLNALIASTFKEISCAILSHYPIGETVYVPSILGLKLKPAEYPQFKALAYHFADGEKLTDAIEPHVWKLWKAMAFDWCGNNTFMADVVNKPLGDHIYEWVDVIEHAFKEVPKPTREKV